jgi:hydrogenase maturation protease
MQSIQDRSMNSNETLILGIGNTLLTDEGAGIHALNHLQSAIPNIWPDSPNLTFLDGGTLSFTLAVWIEDCTNLIVFDATELNRPAGTVNTFVGAAMDEFLGTNKRSAHEVGLLDWYSAGKNGLGYETNSFGSKCFRPGSKRSR